MNSRSRIETDNFIFTGEDYGEIEDLIIEKLKDNGLALSFIEDSNAEEVDESHISVPVNFRDEFGEKGECNFIIKVDAEGTMVPDKSGFTNF